MDNADNKGKNDVVGTLVQQIDSIVEARIQTAPYDKTYDGIITAVKFNKDTKETDSNYNKYTVKFNLIERDFIINDGQIHCIGELVKVHIPNNDSVNKYVETNINSSRVLPVTIVYDNKNDTITEIYNGNLQRKFTLTVENKGTENEEVTSMTFPDGGESLWQIIQIQTFKNFGAFRYGILLILIIPILLMLMSNTR